MAGKHSVGFIVCTPYFWWNSWERKPSLLFIDTISTLWIFVVYIKIMYKQPSFPPVGLFTASHPLLGSRPSLLEATQGLLQPLLLLCPQSSPKLHTAYFNSPQPVTKRKKKLDLNNLNFQWFTGCGWSDLVCQTGWYLHFKRYTS